MNVLRVRGFRTLLAGEAINAIGNWVAIIAIWGFAAFRFDASAGDIALLFVVLSLPGALLGPLLGVPIDRLGPKRTLVLANGLGFVAALALTQAQSYDMIILLAVPLGLIEQLGTASLDALPPRMVADEHLVPANALLGGAQDLAMVVGPAVAALVNHRWGLSGAFLFDAVTFLAGMAVALPLRIGPGAERQRQSTWKELHEGARLVRRTAGIRWTLGVALVTYTLWGLFGVLEPIYVRDVLGSSDTVFALLQTVFGIGLVGAGLTLARLGERMAKPRYVAIATVVSGATAALYLSTEWLAVASFGVFLWGIDVAFFYVPAKTLLQRYAPTTAHGRILSINQSLEPVGALVSTPIAAVAAGALGVQLLGAVGGALAAVAGVIALRLARRLGPLPPRVPVDPQAGSSRDAIALGGSAPG